MMITYTVLIVAVIYTGMLVCYSVTVIDFVYYEWILLYCRN